jgi:phosphoribosylamine--glycine ligase
MGAYAPLGWAPPALAGEVLASVIQPAVDEMRRRGTPYRGLLYAGLSLTAAGVRVVEFNARFGDPETQVVLDRLASPLAGLLAAAASGSLAGAGPLRWAPGASVAVVIAAEGYPAAPVTGDPIDGISDAERIPGAHVLHAGTATDVAGRLVSSGGRVLNVVGTGPDLAAARDTAYRAAAAIGMRGGWYRHDIAEAATQGLPSPPAQPRTSLAEPPTSSAASQTSPTAPPTSSSASQTSLAEPPMSSSASQTSPAVRDAGGGPPASSPGS